MELLTTIKESNQETQIYNIKLQVINTTSNEFSKDLVYRNIAYINRVVDAIKEISDHTTLTPSQKFDLTIAGWLSFIGLADKDKFTADDDIKQFAAECFKYSSIRAKKLMKEVGIPNTTSNRVINILKEVFVDQECISIQSKILSDAMFSDFSKDLGAKYLNKLYRELMLLGVISYSKQKWTSTAAQFLTNHSYLTKYGITHYKNDKIKLIHQLEKKIRAYKRTNETILKKEMNISSQELKQLKKTLRKVKGRNERGVQTMFRTTSRNHYTLNQMLDRKANILISINSILLSVIITKVIGGDSQYPIDKAPIIIMTSTALISILFAILAIIPEKTHGEFTESEIRNKEGNMLFFGNYYNMSIRDYTWGMLQMINDGEHLYMTMIRDLYYFGKQLAKKYKMLRISLFTLGVGLTVSTVLFMIISNM